MQVTTVFEQNWNALSKGVRYIVNSGSSRSSKTYSILQIFYLYAWTNPNKKLSVFRYTKKDCKDTILEDMKKAYPMMQRFSEVQFNITESIFKFPNGSSIHIEGTDDDVKVHGYHSDILWFNESYDISKDTFDQLDMRCTGAVFIDLNPRKDHWSDELIKKENAFRIHSTFLDNPFCPLEQRAKILSYQPIKCCGIVMSAPEKERGGIEQMLRSYDIVNNPNEYTPKQIKELSKCMQNEFQNSASEFKWLVYGLGTKAERPNRIFNFTEIPDHQYFSLQVKEIICVDWGSVDPFGVLGMKYYDGELYLHQLNYDSENKLREKLTPTELAQINADDEGGLVVWLFAKLGIGKDQEIVCDTNRPLKIAALRRAGWIYAVGANKAPGSIIDGIDLLNDMKAIHYTASSTDLKYEQENYSRKVDRYGIILEEPEDIDNHLMDPSRYGAMHLKSKGIINRL